MSYRSRSVSDPPMPRPSAESPRSGSLGSRPVTPISKDRVNTSLTAERVGSVAVDVLAKESRSVNVDLSARNIKPGNIQLLVHGKTLYYSATRKGQNVPLEYEKEFLELNIALLEAVFSKEDINDRGLVPTYISYEDGEIHFRDKDGNYGEVTYSKESNSIFGKLTDNSLTRTAKSFLPGTPCVAIADKAKAMAIHNKLKGIAAMFEQYMTGTRRASKPATTSSDDDQNTQTPLPSSATIPPQGSTGQQPPSRREKELTREEMLGQLRPPANPDAPCQMIEDSVITAYFDYLKSHPHVKDAEAKEGNIPNFVNLGVISRNNFNIDHIFDEVNKDGSANYAAFSLLDGAHFTAVFIDKGKDKRKQQIRFFDPLGVAYDRRPFIKDALERLYVKLFPESGIIPDNNIINIHPQILQRGVVDCGIYCMDYIERELTARLIDEDILADVPISKIYQQEDIISILPPEDQVPAYDHFIRGLRNELANKLDDYWKEGDIHRAHNGAIEETPALPSEMTSI